MKIREFKISNVTRFQIGDKKYRLGRRGVAALNLIWDIACQRNSRSPVTWLLPLRNRIRELEQYQPRLCMTIVACHSRNHLLQNLAISVRGRCGGNFGVHAISGLYPGLDRATRKRLARCLKRLGAWAELRQIFESETDPQIRQIATQTPGRPFEKRKLDFLRHVPRQYFAPTPQRFLVSPEVDFQLGKPAKPRSLIRAVLERIRRIVSGWAK